MYKHTFESEEGELKDVLKALDVVLLILPVSSFAKLIGDNEGKASIVLSSW